MANQTLNVRIQNKFDTFENWSNSSLVLAAGELAIASIPTGDATGLTPPAIGIKVGDGEKTFSELNWIQATAGDVYSWAKAATKPVYAATEITGLEEFVQGISDIDTNTEYSFSLADNFKIKIQKKDINGEYADYQEVDLTNAFNAKADKVTGAVEGNFAGLDANGNLTDSGKKASDFATAGHNHDSKYAAKQATEDHIADSNIHVTAEKKTAWDGAVTKANANEQAISGIKNGTTINDFSAAESAISEAKNAANAAQVDVDALEGYVGTFTPVGEETTVVGYVDAKIAAIPPQTDYSLTVTESTPEGYAKSYKFTQNGSDIATINIPKDMVVKSGGVVELADGEVVGLAAGTYIKLVIANATEDELYIPADALIEYVTGGTAADGIITVSVDPTTHVTTATINDGTITLAKLHTDVQAAINKAHTHDNKIELDKIASGDKAKWDAAAEKAHEHANKTELDKIADGDVAKWNAAQPNVIESISGVAGSITNKDFKVSGVSTDLLTQGANTLILNCGTSAL